MQTRVVKWGNSLGLRLPQAIASHFALQPGSEVLLRIKEGRIVVEPLGEAVYDLDHLVDAITPDNTHGESDWGPSYNFEPR